MRGATCIKRTIFTAFRVYLETSLIAAHAGIYEFTPCQLS